MSYGRGDDDGVTSGVAPGDTSGDTMSGTGGDGSGTRLGDTGGVCSGAIPRGDTPAGTHSSGEPPGGTGAPLVPAPPVAPVAGAVDGDDGAAAALLRKSTGTLPMPAAAVVAGDVWRDAGLVLPGALSGGSAGVLNLCG